MIGYTDWDQFFSFSITFKKKTTYSSFRQLFYILALKSECHCDGVVVTKTLPNMIHFILITYLENIDIFYIYWVFDTIPIVYHCTLPTNVVNVISIIDATFIPARHIKETIFSTWRELYLHFIILLLTNTYFNTRIRCIYYLL